MRRKVIPYGSSRMRTMVAKQILNVDWNIKAKEPNKSILNGYSIVLFIVLLIILKNIL